MNYPNLYNCLEWLAYDYWDDDYLKHLKTPDNCGWPGNTQLLEQQAKKLSESDRELMVTEEGFQLAKDLDVGDLWDFLQGVEHGDLYLDFFNRDDAS